MANRSFARALATLAQRLLPASRQDWGEAMVREFEEVSDDEALGFAAGMVWTATRARMGDIEPVLAMRLGVAFVTALYAGFFLASGLLGVAGLGLVMGATYMAAALFLAFGRAQLFFLFIVLSIAPTFLLLRPDAASTMAVALGGELFLTLAPLVFLAVAGAPLLRLQQARAEQRLGRVLKLGRKVAVFALVGLGLVYLAIGVGGLLAPATDDFAQTLMINGETGPAEAYAAHRAWIARLQLALGAAYLSAGVFLILERPHLIVLSLALTFAPAIERLWPVAYQTPSLPVLAPFAPLALLTVVGGLLLYVERTRAHRLFGRFLWVCRGIAALVILGFALVHLFLGLNGLGRATVLAEIYYLGVGLALLPAALSMVWWRGRLFACAYVLALAASGCQIANYLVTMPTFRGAGEILGATIFQLAPLLMLGAAALVVAAYERKARLA